MNEHIEYFKRWQATYLMWAYSNFDRIVAETVNKHKEEMKQEKIDNNEEAYYYRLDGIYCVTETTGGTLL